MSYLVPDCAQPLVDGFLVLIAKTLYFMIRDGFSHRPLSLTLSTSGLFLCRGTFNFLLAPYTIDPIHLSQLCIVPWFTYLDWTCTLPPIFIVCQFFLFLWFGGRFRGSGPFIFL